MVRTRLPAKLTDIVRDHGGTVVGENIDSMVIKGISTLIDAKPDDLSFYSDAGYLDQLKKTKAAVVVMRKEHGSLRAKPVIIVDDSPRDYIAKVVDEYCQGRLWAPGIAKSAVVDGKAKVAKSAHVGARAVISAGAVVGEQSCVLSGSVVTEDSVVGDDCILHEGCVIGSEGFGFYGDGDQRRRFKHQGKVVIGDRVEIGANSCVDRGVLGDTVIGSGTKIDNLVQVGHNVRIGENCVICGCVAIGGSAELGDDCVVGGGTLIKDHVKIADEVSLMGGTNVIADIREAGGVYGSVIPHMKGQSLMLMWRKLLKAGSKGDKKGDRNG